jgi:hypothetical protein
MMSVPRGSQVVSPALALRRPTGHQYPCLCGQTSPSSAFAHPTSRASAASVLASEPRVTGRRSSPSVPGSHRQATRDPESPGSGCLHYQPGPRPGRASSTASGSERKCAVEAIGRVYCPISCLPPGHGPGAGGVVCQAAGPFRPWGILDRRHDLRVVQGFVTSDASDSDAADNLGERGDTWDDDDIFRLFRLFAVSS